MEKITFLFFGRKRYAVVFTILFMLFAYPFLISYDSIEKDLTNTVYTDTDNDGVPDNIDIDDDNDGITDIMECGMSSFEAITFTDFGFPNGVLDGSLSRQDVDLSTKFGLPPGSILVSVQGASTSGFQFVVGDGFPIEFEFSGTVPVIVKAGHSFGLGAFVRDGIIVLDGVPYEQISNIPPGVVEGNQGNEYFIENSTDASISNSEDYIWRSTGPATRVRFFTTSPVIGNAIVLSLSPVLCGDADGDGIPNQLDIDSDNDGILDNVEAQTDADFLAPCGVDADGNGLDDHYEDHPGSGEGLTPVDTDSDGKPDFLDIDSDNDGIPDNVEGQLTDGYVPPTGNDTDNDGLDDAYEGTGDEGITPEDTDGDTTPDYRDDDSDNDLVPDNNEGNDFNEDGVPDQTPTGTDTDNDGLDDGYEGSDVADGFDVNDEIDDPANDLPDTDGEGDVNYRDVDDDGDGIDTPDEDADGDGDPTDDDTDDDGTPDYLDPDNGDDTDDDGVPDVVDIDDDNDGILDTVEGDGSIDTDGDGRADSLDIDSDDDGIPDNVEGQLTDGYVPPTGNDTDNDGLDDAYEGTGDEGVTPEDTDEDTTPDYRDDDSDNDLVFDNNEGNDFNEDGEPDQTFTGIDTDNDGLDDGYEGSDVADGFDVNDEIDDPANDLPDTDGEGDVNYRDVDDDGDGIDTPDEDADGDGDPTDDDTDEDGTPDYLDPIDDPLPPPSEDAIEVNQLVTPNGDGRNDFLFIRGVENARNNTLKIFNRWGVAVYEGSGYNNINNVFDGRSRGRSTLSVDDFLPAGVYFYIFEYDTDQGRITDSDYFYVSR